MKRTFGFFAAAILASVVPAQAAPVTFSCVFQGAGNVEGTVTINLDTKKATDTFNDNVGRSYVLGQLTDAQIQWHEETETTRSAVTFNRLTGAMTRRLAFRNGPIVDWQYRCSKAQKLL